MERYHDFIYNELKEFAKTDFNTFCKFIEYKKKPILITDYIFGNNKPERYGWTLEDYRRKAPNELRDNPALYETLLRHEKLNKNNY